MDTTRVPSEPVPDAVLPGLASLRGPPLEGFTQFSFASGDFRHPVYYAGQRTDPPLLLMPEIAGFSPGMLMFAQRLVDSRFQVYLPWLFGPFGDRAPMRNVLRLCISREFANLRAGVSAPVTLWLRSLAAHIANHSGGARVGAIGMCLTGAFAIPLVIDVNVVAAVAAQPSVPMSPLFAAFGLGRSARMSELNVSEGDLAAARSRLESGEARLFALRCHADRICPHEKIERLQWEFPVGLEVREYGTVDSRNRLGDRPHATFTKEYRLEPEASADHLSRQAFADLVAFFDRHLRV